MTVSRITVARLHSRGNFEHSRYEVSVVVAPDADPGGVLRDLEQLLEDLKPIPPYTLYGIETYRRRLAESDARRAAGVEEMAVDRADRNEAERHVKDYDAWVAKRDAAFAKLTSLGGTSRDVDAKETWDDEP